MADGPAYADQVAAVALDRSGSDRLEGCLLVDPCDEVLGEADPWVPRRRGAVAAELLEVPDFAGHAGLGGCGDVLADRASVRARAHGDHPVPAAAGSQVDGGSTVGCSGAPW